MMTKIEELWRDALQQARNKPIEANGFRLTRMAPESRFDIYAGVDSSSALGGASLSSGSASSDASVISTGW